MSLGEASYSQTLQGCRQLRVAENCLVVAAAGNDGVPELFFPAGANHAMGVATTTQHRCPGQLFQYRQHRDWQCGRYCGSRRYGIWSTLPTYSDILSTPVSTSSNYGTLDGTSMATPHVAALAGLIAMTTPNLSATADCATHSAVRGCYRCLGRQRGLGRESGVRQDQRFPRHLGNPAQRQCWRDRWAGGEQQRSSPSPAPR